MVNGIMEKMEGISLKKCSIFIIFCIFLSSFSSLVAISQELQDSTNIIYVNPTDDIQQLIDEADENDTLIFNNGVYHQSFRVTKPLILSGFSKEHTLMSFNTTSNNAAISIASPYVTLSQLTIENRASGLYTTGIRIDASQVRIENCIIKDTPIGIAVWEDKVEIVNSIFTNCSDEGILLISTKISSSDNNRISHCVFTNNCDGIELQYSSRNLITDCVFQYNTHAGIDAICNNNNENIISNCSFLDNVDFDIYFSSSKDNLISNCTIQNYQENVLFNPTNKSNIITKHDSFSFDSNSVETTESLKITSNTIIDLIRSMISNSHRYIKNIIFQVLSRIS